MRVFAVLASAALIYAMISATAAGGKRMHPEAYYQDVWCLTRGGETEQWQDDGTRADCITSTHAVEVDFADKWSESVGQAISYSLSTGKRGGIVLILERPGDVRYLNRLIMVVDGAGLPIDVFPVYAFDDEEVVRE